MTNESAFNPLVGRQPQSFPRPLGTSTPGVAEKLPQSSWTSGPVYAVWEPNVTGDYDWYWETPVFNLRPEYTDGDMYATAAVPVNRAAALGAGFYLRVIVFGQPAFYGSLSLEYIECAYDQTPFPTGNQLYAIIPTTDMTDELLAGGVDVVWRGVTHPGATVLYFTPPAEGVRFWQAKYHFTKSTKAVMNLGLAASLY